VDNQTLEKAEAGGKPEGGEIPWGPLGILVLGAFMAVLDGTIVNVALPSMMAIFGVDATRIQWVVTAYLLTCGVVVPVSGYLGDRFGYKRMYIYALAFFTFGSALCALAWNTSSLVAARVVQGVGGGMLMPITMATLYRLVPREKMGAALGIWGISATVAPAVGPTLGGYLVQNFDWRTIFTINIPIGIIAVILAGIVLSETRRRPHLKMDIVGCFLCTAGCFALLLALSEGQEHGWTSYYIINLLIIAGFSLALFVLWELDTPEPMLDVRLFKNAVFTISLIATSVVMVAMFSAVFLISIFTQNLQGMSPVQTGLILMPSALVAGLVMPIGGQLFDRIGAAPIGAVGVLIIAVATYQLHTISLDTSFRYIQVLLAVRSIGLGLTMMPLTTAGLNTIPKFLLGRATAVNNLVRQISASLGIAFLTHVLTQRQAFWSARYAESVTASSPALLSLQQKVQEVAAGAAGGVAAVAGGSAAVIAGAAAGMPGGATAGAAGGVNAGVAGSAAMGLAGGTAAAAGGSAAGAAVNSAGAIGALQSAGFAAHAGGEMVGLAVLKGMLYGVLQKQAAVAAMGDTFFVATLLALSGLPLVFFLNKSKVEETRAAEERRFAAIQKDRAGGSSFYASRRTHGKREPCQGDRAGGSGAGGNRNGGNVSGGKPPEGVLVKESRRRECKRGAPLE